MVTQIVNGPTAFGYDSAKFEIDQIIDTAFVQKATAMAAVFPDVQFLRQKPDEPELTTDDLLHFSDLPPNFTQSDIRLSQSEFERVFPEVEMSSPYSPGGIKGKVGWFYWLRKLTADFASHYGTVLQASAELRIAGVASLSDDEGVEEGAWDAAYDKNSYPVSQDYIEDAAVRMLTVMQSNEFKFAVRQGQAGQPRSPAYSEYNSEWIYQWDFIAHRMFFQCHSVVPITFDLVANRVL